MKTLNHEKILVNTFASEMCLPLNSQTLNFCRQKYRHLSYLNFADSNAENKTPDTDILIGRNDYLESMYDKVVRGESGPVAILTKLGFVLSGRGVMIVINQTNMLMLFILI